ncbi:DedA family protein [Alteribacillus sp. JSM 102045]|uniref:DedA family protein n=1 Tax=Alteribacillus sp. JSM 102045 TaxID=1562101 RepID=UPI0035BFB193
MLKILLDTLEQLGLIGLFLGIAVEAISIPFPAAIVILVYGYIMDPSGLEWVLISLGAAAVYTAVSFIPYWLSLRYDHLLQNRVNTSSSKRMLRFMDKYREWTISAGRILGMGYIVYLAAFYKITPFRYGLFTFIGVLPVAFLMFYLGSLGNIEVVYTWFQNVQYGIMVLIAGAIGWYVYYRVKTRKRYGRKQQS